MIELSVAEYARIPRDRLNPGVIKRLQSVDEHFSRESGNTVFDWSHTRYIQARNYVGVIQVPGCSIEILPKIDHDYKSDTRIFETHDIERIRAQKNLLYMLIFTRRLPLYERDLAGLKIERMPMLEALIAIYTDRLLSEIKRGLDHSYVRKEKNLPFLKGKLLFNEQIRRNLAHQERCFVAYDDFIADTWLNRILKAGSRRMLQMARSNASQVRLREILLRMAEVKDAEIQLHHFDRVNLNRNNERFGQVLDFCKLLLFGQTPSPRRGAHQTFSLVFPMEQLFEEFIAMFIKTNARELGLTRSAVHIQAAGHRKWLLRSESGGRRFQLKPDIVIAKGKDNVQGIIDTKWKRLKPDNMATNNNVSQADLYQVYAYAHEYGSPNNTLLYPKIDGVKNKTFTLINDNNTKLRIAQVDLTCDLRRDKTGLIQDLQKVVHSQQKAETSTEFS